MSVLDQQRAEQSHIDRDWRRPAWICASLLVLGALLGGAMWMQSHGAGASPQRHGYPQMPTVPLTFGFYDLSNRKVTPTDPVWKRFAAFHLDYLLLQGVGPGDGNDAARIAGMTGPDVQVVFKSFGRNYNDGRYAVCYIIARHPLSDVELLSINGEPYGLWAKSQVGDRVIRLATLSRSVPSGKSGLDDLKLHWQQLASVPDPLPPIVVAMDHNAAGDLSGLVEQGTGWFDASATFWGDSAAPLAGHLLFSSGWSCTGGQVIGDPADPQFRRGYVITTAGAASPATHPAGDEDE